MNVHPRNFYFDVAAATKSAAVSNADTIQPLCDSLRLLQLLLPKEECKKAIIAAGKFTSGLLCWHDIRKTTRFEEPYPPRMEFLWEIISLLRRKLSLYNKGKNTHNTVHHKTGLLSFYLRSSMSVKRSRSQRQCAYNAALQLCRVMLPDFTILPRVGGRLRSNFWEMSTYTQRALTEDEFQLELIHYKIDCASKYSNILDSFRHQSFEVMRHNMAVRVISDAEKEEFKTLHGEIEMRRVRDQLFASSTMKHWKSSDQVADEGANVLMKLLFVQPQADALASRSTVIGGNAAKLFLIGGSKSGKTTLCHKLVVRILASKQIKRDFGVIPFLIPVHKLVMNYAKELEDGGEGEDSKEGSQDGDSEAKGSASGRSGEQAWDDNASKPLDDDEGSYKKVDMLDAHFHQECSKFSRRYQALKKLQHDFKLLFIFDGLDEAGPLREHVETYIDEMMKSRHQMVVVTSKQPPITSKLALYKWVGTLPLSPRQQLDYAKRKLDHDELGNARANSFELAEGILSNPNFSKLAANPMMLSMIVSLLGGSSSHHQKPVAGGRASLYGAKESDDQALPFHDKPSMFGYATRTTIAHLDINSGLSETKVESKTIIKFFQKLAWYCHTHTTIDITNSIVVELLQQTENEHKGEGRGEEEEGRNEASVYRHIWNHITTLIKGHAKKVRAGEERSEAAS